MKLRTVAKEIRAIAVKCIGGVCMTLEIGERYSTLSGVELSSVNLEAFNDIDDTDLWETHKDWRNWEVDDNCELDFYVYAGREWENELVDNLGIVIRAGKVVGYHVVGDKRKTEAGETTYDAWRPVAGGTLVAKAELK